MPHVLQEHAALGHDVALLRSHAHTCTHTCTHMHMHTHAHTGRITTHMATLLQYPLWLLTALRAKPGGLAWHSGLCTVHLIPHQCSWVQLQPWVQIPCLPHPSESVGRSIMSDSFADPMDCSPLRRLCPWNSPGKNTGVGCHSLLQGIFPTQGLNPGSCIAGRFFTILATREVSTKLRDD